MGRVRVVAVADPAQAVRPVRGPVHQARYLRDALVVLGAAVLAGAELPLTHQ